MALPSYREQPMLPSIRSAASDRFRNYSDAPFGTSPAQAIPGMRSSQADVPPPLPPPKFPLDHEPHHFGERGRLDRDSSRSAFNSFSSNSAYGSASSSLLEDRPGFKRSYISNTAGADEGYASYPSSERLKEPIPAPFGFSHSNFQFQSAADQHMDFMRKKLDTSRRGDSGLSRPTGLSLSISELGQRSSPLDTNYQPHLSLPSGRSLLESPRWSDAPHYSAVSARSYQFPRSPQEQRSPRDESDVDRSPHFRTTRNNSDDAASTQGSYTSYQTDEMEIDGSSSLKRLHIDDSQGSQKRRAPSPRSDDPAMQVSSASIEAVKRRSGGSRVSPTPRLVTGSSYVLPSAIPTSAPGSASVGRRSPDGPPRRTVSPTSFPPAASTMPNPQTTMMTRGPMHGRNVSSTSPRKLTDAHLLEGSKVAGFFMCECCPKKPKKFATQEALSQHAAEKQYGCQYCGNRFKNKNEAERHQNSLHVRRHAWSCATLSSYDKAFHESTTRSGEADVCGYCGEDFERTGHGPGGKYATEQDLELRNRHLQDVHKFRECNSSKQFFRADHFRQHLKHSHAGTSGKWTNMLENACMEELASPQVV